ncbi:MAG: VWA domain-containing protein [Thermoleophilia bacterium]
MISRSSAPRRLRRSAALAGLIALCAAGTAHADINGTVVNAAGVPVSGAYVKVTSANGASATSTYADAAGAFKVTTSSLSGDPSPYTLTATYTDSCRPSGSTSLSAALPGVTDGATPSITLDAMSFCASRYVSLGATQPTGNAWPERGQVLSPAGGLTYIKVLAGSSQKGMTLTLADGTQVGAGDDSDQIGVTAPAAAYNGPLILNYTAGAAQVSKQIGTLVSGPPVKQPTPAGPFDLAAIVDVSGSMSGADPSNRRRDAVQLLVELAGNGDRLVGTGFDDSYREIFPRTTVTSPAVKKGLKALAAKNIGNFGGTDYDIGFGNAFDAVSADPLTPTTPKGAIFLTDGAHNGTYLNTHLRFAFNGTGYSWPVCVVQLGKSFSKDDTARLQRIAADTGGIFRAAPTNVQLQDLYFQCRGRTTGAQTLLKKTATFRVGQKRIYGRVIKKNQRKATFFVSWGEGKYRLRLTQPGGKRYTRTTGKNVRLVKGRAFSFFEVRNPRAGRWKLQVQRLPTGQATDRATTTVSVQRKR